MKGVVCQWKAKFDMTDRVKTRGQAKNEAAPTPPTGDVTHSTDSAALWRRLQREEDRRAEELEKVEARRAAEQAKEEERHQEWLALEKRKLELEEKHLQQESEQEARHREDSKQEADRRRKDHELDRRLKEISQLPKMSEEEDVEMYLERFEQRMKSLKIPQNRWVDNLRPLMSIWVASTVDALNKRDGDSYPKVKELLLTAYASIKGPGTTETEGAEHFTVPVTNYGTTGWRGSPQRRPVQKEHDPGGDVVTTGMQDPTTDEQTQNHHRNGE